MSTPVTFFVLMQAGGEPLRSKNGSTELIFHGSGEYENTLRLYHEGQCIWTPNMKDRANSFLALYTDGFVRIETYDGIELWKSDASMIESSEDGTTFGSIWASLNSMTAASIELYDSPTPLPANMALSLTGNVESYALVFPVISFRKFHMHTDFAANEAKRTEFMHFEPKGRKCRIVVYGAKWTQSHSGEVLWRSDKKDAFDDPKRFDLFDMPNYTQGQVIHPGLSWGGDDFDQEHREVGGSGIYPYKGGGTVDFSRTGDSHGTP